MTDRTRERIAPSGVEQILRPEELFFSTTDRRGLIRTGNSIFVRVSRYSLSELTGAPHNIVRHPDMPAGVFQMVWDRLLAGQPAGAYMQNLSKDGSHYWVFATITPLGDGFLSVRMPTRAPLFQPVRELYDYVNEIEARAAKDGLNRRDVARVGLDQLNQLLHSQLGFTSQSEFFTEALTAEVTSRSRLASSAFARPWAQGPVAEVLAATGTLENLMASLVQRLEGYRAISDRLVESSTTVLGVARRLQNAVATAQQASAMVERAAVLRNVAEVMATPAHNAVRALEGLVPRLAALRSYIADLRFRIALATLHNDMVALFAAEVVDGTAPPTSLGEVPALCDAVHESATEMSVKAQQVNQTLRDVVHEVTEAGERLMEFRKFLGQWQILVMRNRAESIVGESMRQIDEEFAASWDGIEMLRSLGRDFESTIVPIDVDALERQMSIIRAKAVESREMV
ncbi:aerotaxis receptor [Pseudonocardia thermophila]|jgi:PAS fold.|uniref:Aerotaxis receptor n=1 Tax=Pseudonocardia thermophila TaxID=1848 RepID=A0A1M6XL50_PSETH|nr:PAS domain-containing protein [Pseudonocardia thermophila]SHL06579.1 aerotaxis receptor [Pseudonocardia thermophila]